MKNLFCVSFRTETGATQQQIYSTYSDHFPLFSFTKEILKIYKCKDIVILNCMQISKEDYIEFMKEKEAKLKETKNVSEQKRKTVSKGKKTPVKKGRVRRRLGS